MADTTTSDATTSDATIRDTPRLAHRLRIAALLLVAGLTIEIATLAWSHPTAFLAFAGIGGLLVTLGVVLYLWTVLRYSTGST